MEFDKGVSDSFAKWPGVGADIIYSFRATRANYRRFNPRRTHLVSHIGTVISRLEFAVIVV
jgi:hypothetical protein